MKIIYCPECASVLNLTRTPKECDCGTCGGQYLPDGINAEYYGPAIIFGIGNESFLRAAAVQEVLDREAKPGALGTPFDAFMIPASAATVKKIEQESLKKRRNKKTGIV